MKEQNTRVQVKILDKEYQVACPIDQKEALLKAAQELDFRMRKVRNSGAMVGADRVAVMVALNLCHELQECQQQLSASQSNTPIASDVLERIGDKLHSVLGH